MSLEEGDALAASVQKTPSRVTLDLLKSRIATEELFHPEAAPHVTICVLTTTSGWSLVGVSAPADPTNYDAEVGRKFAYEDALSKLWPLEGYLLVNAPRD